MMMAQTKGADNGKTTTQAAAKAIYMNTWYFQAIRAPSGHSKVIQAELYMDLYM